MLQLDAEDRRLVVRTAIEDLGLMTSPEFETALFPTPREKIVIGGWQAGKSTEAAAEVWVDLLTLEPGRRYLIWIIVTSYHAPHKELDYLYTWAKQQGILSGEHFPEGSSCRIELLNGQVTVETKTAQDIEGIAGEPCDMVLIVEAGQMPETVLDAARGRVMVRRGRIILSGTIEDSDAHPRYAWYEELAERWMADRNTAEHVALSLPSWSNRAAFPEGETDPEIQRLRRIMPPYTFDRRIAGIPGGTQFPVYPLLQVDQEGFDPNKPWTSKWHFDTSDQTLRWVRHLGAGGHDYGGGYEEGSQTIGHPSTLVAATVLPHRTPAGLVVFRDAWSELTGDTSIIEHRRRLMGQRYHILPSRWAFDPMQTQAAKLANASSASGGRGARMLRAGYMEARMNNETLKFDLTNPGVVKLFEQLKRVRRVKRPVAGQGIVWEYARIDDDLAAAAEQAVELIDTKRVDPAELSGELPSLVTM